MPTYKNELLRGEIEHLKSKRKRLYVELRKLDDELTLKQKFYFIKGLCSSCEGRLSDEDIEYKTIYCQECRDNDSVLDWNCTLSD